MAGGRPTLYNEENVNYICKIVATNRHGIRKLCQMFPSLPDYTTIYEWKYRYPEFSQRYLQAKALQMDLVMDELDEIMEETLGYYTDERGNQRIDSPSATIAIAKVNNRKWFASKIAPKLYGDKIINETTVKHEENIQDLG